MHIGRHAEAFGEKPAVIMVGSGESISFAQLNARSNQLAHLFRSRGLGVGGHVAILLENHPRYFEVCWAAQRSGLYITPINWHLGPEEAGYIIRNCGAKALITSSRLSEVIGRLGENLEGVDLRLAIDGNLDGFETYESALSEQSEQPIEDEQEGAFMFYSSGTTGRPKGIRRPLPGQPFGTGAFFEQMLSGLYGFDESTRYLCPAPLYHAAPIGWSMGTQRLGGTAVIMERFDAHGALRAIDQHQIDRAQFVPTHFVRMLKLPKDDREQHDLSSLERVIHAAAPCPIEVKEQIMDWWGPLLYEYYAGSEGNGFCAIGPDEWLSHRGSVGQSKKGPIHIVNEEGVEQAAGEIGQIWFEGADRFEYHGDPAKTAEAWNDQGWSTLGDVGYLDDEGYLYLTDRISHMIISGGVNIYPQEIEDALVLHPAVADVAVIGVPHPEMGEEVKAVVQADQSVQASDALAEELIAFCRERIAHFKCPRSIDFTEELPRLPTGKLLKRTLRDQYSS